MRPSKGGNYGPDLHRARHLARTARCAVPRAAWPPHGVDRHLGRHGCDQVARESGRLPVGLARHAGLHQPARRRHDGRDLALRARAGLRWGRRARPSMCSIPTASPSCIATGAGGHVSRPGPGHACAVRPAARRHVRQEYVTLLEGAVIDTLAGAGVAGACKPGAPGVCRDPDGGGELAKIAALGIKIRNGRAYHGVSLNVDMDLTPFLGINPCGYAGLRTVDMAACGVRRERRTWAGGAGAQSGCRLAPRTATRSAANPPVSRLNAGSDAAFIRFPARSFSSDMKSITAADISATTPEQLAARAAVHQRPTPPGSRPPPTWAAGGPGHPGPDAARRSWHGARSRGRAGLVQTRRA